MRAVSDRPGYDRDNVFARILRDEIPSNRVYEDEEFVAFRDINPAAPTHIVIPRGEPPAGPAGLGATTRAGRGGCSWPRAHRGARGAGRGRLPARLNDGADAGQEVPHIHLHILGGDCLARSPDRRGGPIA